MGAPVRNETRRCLAARRQKIKGNHENIPVQTQQNLHRAAKNATIGGKNGFAAEIENRFRYEKQTEERQKRRITKQQSNKQQTMPPPTTLSQADVNDFSRVVSARYNQAQAKTAARVHDLDPLLEELCTAFPVQGAASVHGWLLQLKGFREWIGNRQFDETAIQGLIVANRAFEHSVKVPLFALQDNQAGTYMPLVDSMAAEGANLWKTLLFEALEGNAGWLDGNPFFCSGRVIGTDAGGNPVTLTNAGTGALNEANLTAAIKAMQTYRLHSGFNAQVTPETLLVGPSLEAAARTLILAQLVGGGNTNILYNRLKVRVHPLVNGNHWYVLGNKFGLKAFAVQQRMMPDLRIIDSLSDAAVALDGNVQYNATARGEAFGALPYLVYAGGLDTVAAWTDPDASSEPDPVI